MFFEDRGDVSGIDLWNNQFTPQFIDHTVRIIRWIFVVNIQNDFLRRERQRRKCIAPIEMCCHADLFELSRHI